MDHMVEILWIIWRSVAHSPSCSVAEGQGNGKFSQNGTLGHSCVRVTKSRLHEFRVRDHVIMHLGLHVSSSAHNCVCVVDGGNAMAAI